MTFLEAARARVTRKTATGDTARILCHPVTRVTTTTTMTTPPVRVDTLIVRDAHPRHPHPSATTSPPAPTRAQTPHAAAAAASSRPFCPSPPRTGRPLPNARRQQRQHHAPSRAAPAAGGAGGQATARRTLASRQRRSRIRKQRFGNTGHSCDGRTAARVVGAHKARAAAAAVVVRAPEIGRCPARRAARRRTRAARTWTKRGTRRSRSG